MSISILGWRIWYDDGSVYDSREDDWADLPDDGVLVMYTYKSDGRRECMTGQWYYRLEDDRGVTYDSDWTMFSKNEVHARYPGAVLKRGRRAPLEFFESVRDAAEKYDWFGVS